MNNLSNEKGKPTVSEEGKDCLTEVVDSNSTIMEHEAEPINVEEKFEVEVQESEAKTTYVNISAEEANMTSDDQFDELVESIDECFFATPICDQLLDDDVSGLVQSEIQPIFIITPVLDSVIIPRIAFLVHV